MPLANWLRKRYKRPMLIGHLAASFLARRACPKESLGTAMLAAQWPDLVWSVLVLVGVEQVSIQHSITAVYPLNLEYMPWSHSLLMNLVWAALGGTLFVVLGRGIRTGFVMAGAIISHWLLDALSHGPDMPLGLASETARVGLGLWYSLPATIVVEMLLFALSIWLYRRATPTSGPRGARQLRGLIGFLLAFYAVSLFGPQPKNGSNSAILAVPGLLMVAIAWWGHVVDRNRLAAPLNCR